MHSEEFIDQVKTNWRNILQKRSWRGCSLEAYCRQVETCTRIALSCVDKDTGKRPGIVMVISTLNEHSDGRGMRCQRNWCRSLRGWSQDRIINQNRYFNNLIVRSSHDEKEFDIREKSLDVGEEFIVGRKEEKRKIVASLLQSMTQQITILPIYGIGGIGKTTFAKLIYNDTNFNCYSRVWVYVSPRFDLNKVGNSIISQLSRKESQIKEIEMIHSRMVKLLYGKKILIVLDDLWEDNLFQLNSLKDMLNYGDSINVIVLVTTRSKHVAENISTNVQPHGIEPLTNDMCWDIIKQRSGFEAKDHKEQLTLIGMKIALKCGGVALAAQSLGFMLKPMELCSEWIEVKDSEIWNEPISEDANLPNHVLASLMLSCTKMDRWLVSCFTYCAIFPKGHHIVKEELIQQWISLGFIQPTKLHSSMQLCEKYIMQLVGLSFLQHTMSPMYSQAYKKGLTLFTMHDLVHDLARLLMVGKIMDASNINTGEQDASNTGRQGYEYALLTNSDKPLKSLMDSPAEIRALHFRDCHRLKGLQDYAFSPAQSLEVLDLSGCNIAYLPTSISELVQLRYLHAPDIKSKMLPDSLTKLSNLIYLNLSGSNISALPYSIGDIKGLMHLDISNCVLLCELPESFLNLKNLVHLDLSHCRIKITAKVFGGLTNIQHLNLSKSLSHGSDGLEGLQEAIGSLTELRYLNLSRCFENLSPDEILSLIDRICMLPYLLHLDLSFNSGIVSVPESISSLRKLQTMDLLYCRNLVKLPKCMLDMDSLKILNVTCCPLLDRSTLPRSKYFTLPYFEVHAVDGESSSNIGLLQHVNPTYELHISGLDNMMCAEEVDSINLREKQGIQSLSLEWTRDARRSVEDVEVLGKLVPPDTLKCFELRGYHSMSFPAWVMGITLYLPRLTKIVLWELRKCNSLPPLGQLPTLQKLVMGGMDSALTIEEGFCCAGPGAFPLLQEFHLCQMENLEVWNTTYSCGQNGDVQEFMFPNLRELLIRDCPKLRLKPCPPKTVRWKIENSDNVLSSWDEEGEISLAALLLSREEFKKLWEGKTKAPAAQWEKCRKPGASYNACPEGLEVKSSKLPLEQWRLFHHLLPTYDLRISGCTCLTSSSQEIIRDLSYIESLCLEDNAQSELPKWLGELTSLQTLEISKYPGLEAPLDGMKQLAHLRKLLLTNCRSMSTLPQWLGELTSLKELIISDWPNLSDIPESMQRLTSLKMLRLVRCPRITALPEWLRDIASLKILIINNNCGGSVSVAKVTRGVKRVVPTDPAERKVKAQKRKAFPLER